jgi:hypothetical protein
MFPQLIRCVISVFVRVTAEQAYVCICLNYPAQILLVFLLWRGNYFYLVGESVVSRTHRHQTRGSEAFVFIDCEVIYQCILNCRIYRSKAESVQA